MKRTIGGFVGGEGDLRTMFQALGMGGYKMPMAIQFAYFLPSTTDPDAPGVMMIVEGLQRGLKRLGFPVEIDGWLGPRTGRALEIVSGPRWRDKTWAQLAGDVLSARPLSVRARGAAALEDYSATGAVDPARWERTKRGSCSPVDTATLAVFKNLQRQQNRVASLLGISRIGEDGVIGSKTVDQAKAIGAKAGDMLPFHVRSALSLVTTCDSLARVADSVADALDSAADANGAPAVVSTPKPRAKVTVNPDGTLDVQEPSQLTELVTSPLGLAAIGVGALLMLGGKKRRKRKRK